MNYQNFLKFYEKEFLKKKKFLLKILTLSFNNIHNKNFKKENYKFLLGPWLDEFLKIYLLRKYHLRFIKKKLKMNKNTNIFIHNDYADFVINSNNLNFNLNFFSKLQRSKNKFNYRIKNIKKKYSFIFKVKFKIYLFMLHKLINKNTILLIHSKFDKFFLIKLFFKSRFNIVPFIHNNIYHPDPKYIKKNFMIRDKFKKEINKLLSKKSLVKLITDNIPAAYLENFKYYDELSEKIYPKLPKAIFTTTCHLENEILKFSLMKWSSIAKPKIYISQHGGNYSISNQLGLGCHDYEISDKYFTWGYKFRKKDISSNALQVISKINNYRNFKKNYVTFILGPNILNDFQRYVYQNVNYKKLYQNRLSFLKNFKDSKKLIFKKYFEKRYTLQDDEKIIKKKLSIQSNKITNNFEIIYESKILIFDYFSTMFFEIINLKIPFIFILDEKNFYFSKIGIDLINFLKNNNLLFKSGDIAAKHLNKINNFEKWWETTVNQNELNIIKSKVANIELKNLQFWVEQFNS